jgi:hypothetical protein
MSRNRQPAAGRRRIPERARPQNRPEQEGCTHVPPCPGADHGDRDAARVVASHPEQGWSLLCNHVVVFDDTGELLPDGSTVPPHRPHPLARTAA